MARRRKRRRAPAAGKQMRQILASHVKLAIMTAIALILLTTMWNATQIQGDITPIFVANLLIFAAYTVIFVGTGMVVSGILWKVRNMLLKYAVTATVSFWFAGWLFGMFNPFADVVTFFTVFAMHIGLFLLMLGIGWVLLMVCKAAKIKIRL